ncbi:DNA topoisomerase (ATP-hydrolyzing) subunit B [Malacoplasma penetrans]|uniref:DNA gyrase subunit B n=1 Tax=Malacoplasma penetrans (strain HF-2) TaxID=272633 RepID=Q8EX47_MALP2|nr:DNA topoisomerase (ATP-hydrolyzing) subunit B [Malacoplasma penetrans]RXY96884.1 DNA topoisomerase (ATP-hydrolyzing) subunit B [Malacoplasma penetrans]BAC43793.1 DNA gyrase subunit B [Malacoplasma penetrans HF-2]
MNKETKKNTYSASNIKILEGLEAVRKRPGMYIGSTDIKGLHHMVWEIVDNSIDEAMTGNASEITITLTKEGSAKVQDDGRGIPVEKHAKTKKSTVETVLTVLHAGGKFDNDSYKVSGGLHGVGASVVNALSSWLKVWVYKEYKEHYIEFKDGGKPVADLKVTNEKASIKNGTIVEFYPDFEIMERAEFDADTIKSRLKQLAYLNKGIKINFIDERTDDKETFLFAGGIKQWVEELNNEKEPIVPTIVYDEREESVKAANNKDKYNIRVEVAFQYNKTYNNSTFTFCNNINTTEGGSHEEGFKFALQKIINKFAVEKKLLKETDEKISKEDAIEGLTAIVSIKHPNPQYEGQTKRKLGNSEVRPFVSNVVSEIFEKYLLENPEDANVIIKKCLLAMEARKKSFEAREATRRKSPFESNSLPGKLADCSTKDKEISELYIVEGDSAGGSAKLGRDRIFQAILPLKGKIINVEKAKSDKIFSNEEIINLITAIGAGVGPEFKIDKLRYNKIILMTDADVDGSHIRILLLTFLFRYMYPLLENGNVYIACPPLFKFSVGKSSKYAYDEKTLEEFKKENSKVKYQIQRYKGLGEMNPDQLWETTMDPKNRLLLKVTIEDALNADKVFSLLMGDEVAPRREFIEKNAKYVKNLDI